MRIASLHLSALSTFSYPLHALARWLQPALHGIRNDPGSRPRSCKAPLPCSAAPVWPAAPCTPAEDNPPADAARATTAAQAARSSSASHTGARHPQARRVVRVLRTSASGSDAGRIVISGRMADVCAELDRMAAREALLQH